MNDRHLGSGAQLDPGQSAAAGDGQQRERHKAASAWAVLTDLGNDGASRLALDLLAGAEQHQSHTGTLTQSGSNDLMNLRKDVLKARA